MCSGVGTLVLEVHCTPKKPEKTLELRARPWMAYSAANGARVMLRKIGDAEGRCCTLDHVRGAVLSVNGCCAHTRGFATFVRSSIQSTRAVVGS